MTSDLRPYPEYKDSGVPWLGRVPAHWDLRASKRFFTESGERAWPDDEQLSATQSHGVILQRDYERLVGRKVVRILHHLDKRKHVEKDNFVISMRSFQGGLERAWSRGAIRSSYVVLKQGKGIHVPYFAHLFKSHPYIQALRTTSEFIRDGQDLTFSNFCLVPLPVVPINEQKVIAHYLDDNEAKIRRFIRNRRRLIEVLNEQKQAIINRAVTRGLDPNAPLKPSGIDWLGDIPEHWTVGKLVSRYDQCLGKMVDAKRFKGDHAIPYLRNIDVQWDRINTVDLPIIDIAPRERVRFTIQPGDLLVCEGGDVGRCAFWNGELEICGFQKALHRLRPLVTRRDYPRFLFYCMFNASKLGIFIADGSENTIAHLTGVKLRAHRFAFPPFDEQKATADHLDATLRELHKAIAAAEREIALIREYRTRLIADVVTGKLDVRHVNSQAPAAVASVAASAAVKLPRGANIHFKRAVFAAEIVHRLHDEPTFGHVKCQKLIFLCERRCGVDTGSKYHRDAAGPYDNRALRSIDKQVRERRWYEARKGDRGYRYVPLEMAGGHRRYFDRYFAGVAPQFDEILDTFRTAKTVQCEIVATLYAAWEDLLAESDDATDDQIVEQVLHHWHSSKQKIDEGRWRRALGWMKAKDLIPKVAQ